jgi:hypothetical protein
MRTKGVTFGIAGLCTVKEVYQAVPCSRAYLSTSVRSRLYAMPLVVEVRSEWVGWILWLGLSRSCTLLRE